MKKQIKILGVLAIALTLGLSACNGGGGGDSQGGKDGSSSKHQHTAAENAPWQHDDSRHWKDCVANDGGKVDNKAHDFEDVSVIKDSTCTEVGSKNVKCKVCGFETTKEIALKDHEYIPDTNKEDIEATCTTEGHTYTICKNCNLEHDEVINALGHSWGEWEVTKAAKCEETGSRKHTCSRCNLVEDEVIPALGHKLVTKDTADPAPGKAAVRVYECQNEGCDVTFFGFKATETSPNSGRLVEETDSETGDVGKRFWGRPIGNDVALDDTGGASQDAHDPIYNPETQGDLFEYVFTLTQEQINVMGDTVACYADAAPANYLGGQDFWACDPSAEEWTPGYYIEGEKAGTPIADYRYILYVDGHPVEFDHRMKAPVTADGTGYGNQQNLKRHEFLMPYVFHFTAGEHSISLRMAGGYRSVFYNFIFRPYEVPAEIPVTPASVEIKVGETAQLNSSLDGLTFKSANISIATVSETGLVTGVKSGETSITVSKEGNFFPTTVPVKINEKDGIYQVEAETGVSSKDEEGEDQITFRIPSGGASGSMTNAFPKDATLTIKFNATAAELVMSMTARGVAEDLGEVMSVKLNDADISLTGKALNSQYTMVSTSLGEVNLKDGENTIVVKALAESGMPNIDFFRFEPASELPPEPEHTHVYEDTKVDTLVTEGCTTVDVFNCKDGDASVLRWDAHNYDATSNDIAEKDGGIRLNKVENQGGTAGKGAHLIYKINSPVAVAKAGLAFDVTPSSNGVDLFDAVLKADGTSNDSTPGYVYEGENLVLSTKRYALKVNGVEVQIGSNNYGSPKDRGWYNWPVEFALNEGVNTIEIIHLGGYRAVMYNFQLTGFEKYVHVHNWTDGTAVAASEGKSGYTPGTCACGAKRINFDLATSTTGNIEKGGKINKSNKTATFVFDMTEEIANAAVWLKISVDNAGNEKYGFHTGKNGGSSPVDPLPDGKTNTTFKMNDNVLVLPGEDVKYSDLGVKGIGENNAGICQVATCSLINGTNKLEITCTDSYAPNYWEIFIVY